jgi:predicted Zn-dependent protease
MPLVRKKITGKRSNAPGVVLALLIAALTFPTSGGVSNDGRAAYEYTSAEVVAAAEQDLQQSLAPYAKGGRLNRDTPELMRVKAVSAALIKAVRQNSPYAHRIVWRIYLHEGRLAEAYSRAGGQIVISIGFIERYQPDDAQLAFVIGHEMAHVLCEHERIRLSAVWRRNAPQNLPARYAMEYLDTEPMVRAQIAPIANSQERTADRIGMQLAASIGVDALAAARFFDTSAAKDDAGIMPDDHDAPAERKASLLHGVARPDSMDDMQRTRSFTCAP